MQPDLSTAGVFAKKLSGRNIYLLGGDEFQRSADLALIKNFTLSMDAIAHVMCSWASISWP